MKYGKLTKISFIMLVIIAASMHLVRSDATAGPIVLKFAGNTPLDNIMTKCGNHFCSLVNEKAQGRLRLDYYPTDQLGKERDLVKFIPGGVVDLAILNLSYWTSTVPILGLLRTYCLYDDFQHIHRALDAGVRDLIFPEAAKMGIKILSGVDYSTAYIMSRKPLSKIEDLKGLKIRGTGDQSDVMIAALGGATVTLTGAEVYMALQRGTVDAATTTLDSMLTRKMFEVAPYVTDIMILPLEMFLSVSLKKFNSLPKEFQTMLIQCAEETQEWSRVESQKINKTLRHQLKEKGMTFVSVEPKEAKRIKQIMLESIMNYSLPKIGEKGDKVLAIVEATR